MSLNKQIHQRCVLSVVKKILSSSSAAGRLTSRGLRHRGVWIIMDVNEIEIKEG